MINFILFGGKGGVGKTTMAAAASLQFANLKTRVLISTTDPAPSLADSFGQPIGSEPTAILKIKNLFAMEIDAKQVLKEFRQEYGKDISDILQQGTYLADPEIEEMISLDIPGLDEVMALKKITDFMESHEYQLYIIDTAPTGHTLRLLTLPDLIDDWIKFLASLRWKYHTMVRHFAREQRLEKADQFLLEMKKTIKKVRSLLQDSSKTEFITVTIPEALGVRETEDLINNLERLRIPSNHIIINNIFPKNNCAFCQSRRRDQNKYINQIKEKFKDRIITEVGLQDREVKGINRLKELGKLLFKNREGMPH